MTICTLGAASAAPRNNIHSDSFRVRTLMLGLLLSSVATAAIAQDASPPPPSNGALVPGSTNTPQQEQTNSNATAAPAPTAPAPQADDVAQPASGSAVVENAPAAPQDSGSGLGAIIVTATKRETNLQRTPIAISVANTQALTDRHASACSRSATARSRAFASRPSKRVSLH